MDGNSFNLFGVTHVITLAVVVLVTIGVLHYLLTLPDQTQQEIVLPILGWLVLGNLILWRVLLVVYHQFDITRDLPLAVCGISMILLVVYIWRPGIMLFDVLFHWILIGSSLAILLPDLHDPFPSIRFFSMFVGHGVGLCTMLYLVIVRKQSPTSKSYNLATLALVGYGFCIALPVDILLHANYLFLLAPPNIDLSLVSLLPTWPWYWIVLLIFFHQVFRLTYHLHLNYFHQPIDSQERYV